jgi:hypothetical protein
LAKRPDFLVGRKFQFRPEFSQTEISVPTPKALPMWEALGPELARLKKRFPSRPLAEAHTAYLRQLFATHPKGAALPEEWIKALAELDHRLKGTDPSEILLLKWHLFQGLWGVAPTGACADLLKVLGLRHATPGFWGLYLDSLLADRRFRFALEDVRQTLIKHPHLNWARIGHIRLPLIWDGLMVHGFFWNEDQGVPALIAALSIRPRPKLSAILGNAFKPKRARP